MTCARAASGSRARIAGSVIGSKPDSLRPPISRTASPGRARQIMGASGVPESAAAEFERVGARVVTAPEPDSNAAFGRLPLLL